jgi:hypothetical protein
MKRFHILLALLLAGLACPAVQAQTDQGDDDRPARRTGGLFAREPENPLIHHRLDLTVSAAEAYDSNVLDLLNPVIEGPVSTASGFVSSFDPALSYAWRGNNAALTIDGGTRVRHYANQQGLVALYNFGGVAFIKGLSRRTTLFLHQSASYLPDYLFVTVPLFDAPSIDNVVDVSSSHPVLKKQSAYRYDSGVRIDHALSSVSSFSLVGRNHYADFASDAESDDLEAYDVGGRYQRTLSRNMTLRLGYMFRGAKYADQSAAPLAKIHEIDGGVDYRRALSFSRRTRLFITAGSALLNRAVEASDTRGRLTFQATGQVSLDHEMGRSWRARLMYTRTVGLIERLQDPLLSDALRASIGGLASPRVSLQVEGGMSFGEVVNPLKSGNDFRTYQASARMEVAVARRLAVYSEYVYYHYDIGAMALLGGAQNVPLHRNSVSAGLSVWQPLLRR